MATQDIDFSQDFSDRASTFGDRITAAREEMGMDPTQLARKLGIKKQTLINWEEDLSEPRANKLQMLAGLLNVSIIWLMSGEGEGPRQTEEPSPQQADMREMLSELMAIREAQATLAVRCKRLEKRLRATVQ